MLWPDSRKDKVKTPVSRAFFFLSCRDISQAFEEGNGGNLVFFSNRKERMVALVWSFFRTSEGFSSLPEKRSCFISLFLLPQYFPSFFFAVR